MLRILLIQAVFLASQGQYFMKINVSINSMVDHFLFLVGNGLVRYVPSTLICISASNKWDSK